MTRTAPRPTPRAVPEAPPPIRRGAWRAAALLALAPLAAGCAADPIVWAASDFSEPIPPPSAADGTASPAAVADSLLRVAVARRAGCPGGEGATEAGACPAILLATEAAGAAGGEALPAADACPGSFRLARAGGDAAPPPVGAAAEGVVVAAWWSPRPDRSAWLLASRSTDGGRSWSGPIPVDTLDRATSGCDRPPPAIALDARNGYVHVAYPLVAPEGTGIFYAHQMDPRAAFEPPQVVVYGERASATSVASDGDVVAVAYEDPNTGGRPFVSLALSRTAGHTFDARLAVSGRSVAAVRPRVAVRGPRVSVGWIERPSPRTLATVDDPSTAAGPQPGYVVVRSGTVR